MRNFPWFVEHYLKTIYVGIFLEQHLVLVSTCICTQHFISVTNFVTILCEVFITNIDILKFFCHKNVHPDKAGQRLSCQLFISKQQIIKTE